MQDQRCSDWSVCLSSWKEQLYVLIQFDSTTPAYKWEQDCGLQAQTVSGEWALPLPHEASALQVLSPDLTWDRQQSLSSQSAGDTQALIDCFWITPSLTCAGVKPARTVPCSPEALRVLSDVQLAKYQSVIIKLYDLITVCEDRVGNQHSRDTAGRRLNVSFHWNAILLKLKMQEI